MKLAVACAACLTTALVLDLTGHNLTVSGPFTVAGLVFLVAAILFPHPRHRRLPVSKNGPTFGHTKTGLPVHARFIDHLPHGHALDRFNSRLAVRISKAVGSMYCAYAFCLLALLSLPAVLTIAGYTHFFPHWLVAAGLIALVAWIAQTFLQLVLLRVIMVGQDVMGRASDARSAKTFEDVEAVRTDLTTALDRLDERTEGGIKAVLDAVNALAAQVAAQKTTPAKRLATRAERSEGSGK